MKSPDSPPTRGFTLVELMMSLTVLAIGVSGVIAMQKVTAVTNMHSKSVAIATQIARGWQDQLLVDGSLWRNSTTLNNSTTWLKNATADAPWIRPPYVETRQFGGAFDALGNPLDKSHLSETQFCVHLQLIPVVALTDAHNATIRASIRVLWPRSQGEPVADYCQEDGSPTPETIGNDTVNFHSIYQTIAIRVHP